MGLIVQNYGPDCPIVRTYLILDSLRGGDLAIEQLLVHSVFSSSRLVALQEFAVQIVSLVFLLFIVEFYLGSPSNDPHGV